VPRAGSTGFIGVVAVSAFILAPCAVASDWIANGGSQAVVSANAAGDVAVAWTESGTRTEFVIPPSGKGYHGALPGTDVSNPASVPGLAFAPTARRTPAGWFVALQRWNVAGQPEALHVARWKGAPTAITLSDDGTRLSGTTTFDGKPVTGFSTTPRGTRQKIYVYVDCFGCPAAPHGWAALIGVAPKADGSFAVALKPGWQGSRYRASVQGPNLRGTLAPDAQVVASAA